MGGHPYGRGASCPGHSPWTSRTGRCGGTTGPEFKTKENILGWDSGTHRSAGHRIYNRTKTDCVFNFCEFTRGDAIRPVHRHLFIVNTTDRRGRGGANGTAYIQHSQSRGRLCGTLSSRWSCGGLFTRFMQMYALMRGHRGAGGRLLTSSTTKLSSLLSASLPCEGGEKARLDVTWKCTACTLTGGD